MKKKLKMSPLANCNIKVLRLKLKSIDVAKVKIYIFDWFLPLIYWRADAYMATPLTIIYFFYHMKQLESMLQCICKGTDHWRC